MKLKTLKDIFHPLLKTIYFKPIKTEKEFTKWLNEYRENKQKELKAEAVKWVKSDFVIQKYVKIYTAKDWIKHFFNITEEDLK